MGIILVIISSTIFSQPSLVPTQTINSATGSMQFSIPLVELTVSPNVSFPVTLNYSSGIHLHQEASPAGLGFAYEVGAITRKSTFIPDNNVGGDFYHTYTEQDCDEAQWKTVLRGVLMVIGIVITLIISILSLGTGSVPAFLVFASFFLGMGTDMVNSYLSYNSFNFKAGGSHSPTYLYTQYDGKGFFQGGIGNDLPDVYFVNTPFITGRLYWIGDSENGHFVFDQTRGSIKKERSTVEVNYDKAKDEFEIILQDGTRLLFEEKSKSPLYLNPRSYENDDGDYCYIDVDIYQYESSTTQWHLTKVLYPDYVEIDANNKKGSWVELKYKVVEEQFLSQMPKRLQSGKAASTLSNTFSSYSWFLNNTSYTIEDIPPVRLCILENIETQFESCEFNYSYDRKDNLWIKWDYDLTTGPSNPQVYDMPVLKDISLKSKDIDGEVKGKFQFNTSYKLRPNSWHSFVHEYNPFNSSKIGEMEPLDGNPLAACLTLESVDVIGRYGKKLPPIVFRYLDTNPDGLHRHTDFVNNYSIAIEEKDLWGYYCPNTSNKNDYNAIGNKNKAQFGEAWSIETSYHAYRNVYHMGLRTQSI